MPREFEMADITFQAVVSAANFAQLKRHRLATLMAGDYAPELGIHDAGQHPRRRAGK